MEETQSPQKEILAKNIQVSHKNKVLKNLRERVQNDVINQRERNKILKSEQLLDMKFEEFEKIPQKIHPKFHSRLQQPADQKLTAIDLKYCLYIFIKMPSKEMADLLHVELQTIRINKYRLKLKLNLKREDKLDEFIQTII